MSSLPQPTTSAGGAPPTRPQGASAPRRLRTALLPVLEAYAMVGLLALVVIFFSFYSKTSEIFPTSANVEQLIGGQAVVAIIALAALIPLICNEWDLSVGATAGMSSIFAAAAMSHGTPVILAILLGIGLGALVGLLNAVIITRVGVSAVITTLGMATIIEGVVNQKSGGLAIVADIPSSVVQFGSENWLGVPRTAYALALAALVVYYALNHTPVGRQLYALGANYEGARLVGLRTKVLLGGTFVAAGALAGAAGVLQVARAGGADPRVGTSLTLPALAAAFLSAAAIKPGRFNVAGTLVAIFFLAALNNGLNLAGAAPYVSSYINGGALILGVGLAAFLGRKRTGAA